MVAALLDFCFPPQCAACNALGTGLCAFCVPPLVRPLAVALPGLRASAYGEYAGALRTAILALKDGRRDVAQALGERLAPLIAAGCTLVPVPTTARRMRRRGCDGVELIARHAARIAGARVCPALSQSAGDTQRGRGRADRLAARGRFRADPTVVGGACVTLLDDVCTTGATLADCANAIEIAGGRITGAVVVAATKIASTWRTVPTDSHRSTGSF